MKINIAISLNITDDPNQSIWSNGANQHCVFLYMLLRQCPLVDNVWLAHSEGIAHYPAGLLMDDLKPVLRPLSTVLDSTDLFIEMNSRLSPEHVARLRERGAKLVSYRFGNAYVAAVEATTFGAHHGWSLNLHFTQFDEVWTNAQHERTCKSFFEATMRAPVYTLPHPWSPRFIEKGLNAKGRDLDTWGYRNVGPAKRIAVFEPAINVVKSPLIPLLAANELYRHEPDRLDHLYLCGAHKMKDNLSFNGLAYGLEVIRAGKTTATTRQPFFDFAGHCTDIVLSHQWENGLNYLFYEALYGGYPLVHNSPFLRKVGYYYEDFDIYDAVRALQRAIVTHDDEATDYTADCRRFLNRFSTSSVENVEAYTQRIRALFEASPE
ncbi:hypothetical protein WJ60_06440 [Burkholderia ubonensis]|uniref:DUF2827 family protein n=1 Tax=Burkholderia ubonensis TaxID=101571 RepID=UPI000758541E|nr:DUF2827 family protein [Burkholderia ubonensis]KVM73944.1 hypothetical protein WJ60_06440 [Burkholderia ubonensis]